jgi:hypothetical protein
MANFLRGESDRVLLERYRKMREDPIEFLKCVRTLDQVDRDTPVKPFPIHLKYIQFYIRYWQRKRLIAVPKSRRMKMSWTNISLYVWDTMFNLGRHQAFVSKKEDDSDELIKRAKFIIENLDEKLFPKELRPKHDYTFGKLKFPELESLMQGFASGADQLRQFTFSGILADEMAFWENAQAMYSGSFPVIEGGGRFTAISSAGPGFFKRLVFDKLDHGTNDTESDSDETVEAPKEFPMQGLEVWDNPKNKFFIFQLHYTADENKRSEEWKVNAKSGMPVRDWNQEYEINWDTFEGLPVYADWNKRLHAVQHELSPKVGLPLLIGYDFGLTPAAIIAQKQGDQLVVLKEFIGFNIDAEQFSERVIGECRVLFREWADLRKDWICFIDPSGTFRKDTDSGTCAQILDSKGYVSIPGPVAFEARKQGVDYFLTKMNKGGPALVVSAVGCPVLVKGFEGGYMFPEKALDLEPNKLRPLKNAYSHPHDAFQYLCCGIKQVRRSQSRAVPKPSFASTGSFKR